MNILFAYMIHIRIDRMDMANMSLLNLNMRRCMNASMRVHFSFFIPILVVQRKHCCNYTQNKENEQNNLCI